MIENKFPKLIWGILAFAIYFFLLILLVFYFNMRQEKRTVNYVKKNENRIQVSLSTPKNITEDKVVPSPILIPKSKSIVKPKPKVKSKLKPIVKPKSKKKPIVKPKPKVKPIVKAKRKAKPKKKPIVKPKRKKKKTSDLFASIKTPKKKQSIEKNSRNTQIQKNFSKIKGKRPSANERISSSMKLQKNRDRGVENAYFAKVKRILEGWPAQNDYVGEKAIVRLSINPSGRFKFKVISASRIDTFNTGLEEFLKQLQRIGFGRHTAGKTYQFKVEFIAKD